LIFKFQSGNSRNSSDDRISGIRGSGYFVNTYGFRGWRIYEKELDSNSRGRFCHIPLFLFFIVYYSSESREKRIKS